jgi:segregation and condensation protein A
MMTSEPGEPVLPGGSSLPGEPAMPGEPVVPGETTPAGGGFQVHLDVFEGPFDLLLGLISKHKLDITEIALSSVTDEFIGYIRALAGDWDLDQASYFLVVAATLLDLKAARLLPSGEVDDEEDLALLEARDLLFARLLQYRAYREVSGVLAGRMAAEGKRYPRRVPMEPRFAELLPEVLIGLGPTEFAAIAARVLAPRRPPTVSTAHLHVPRTSVREQAEILLARLRSLRRATFRQLIADCAGTYEVVARFLAVLELYRDGRVGLDQIAPLGDLYVSWAERPEPAESERATPEPPDGGPLDAEPPGAEPQDAEPAPAGDRQMHPDEEDGHDDA